MPEIRALTLHQPWASLVAWGVKRYETRPKPLSYRGPLAIHAAKVWDAKRAEEAALLLDTLWLTGGIHCDAIPGLEDLHLGCVVAVVDMVGCERMDPAVIGRQHKRELLSGDWRPGRYAYRLANVRPLETPIPARGQQGLWRAEVPEGVLRG